MSSTDTLAATSADTRTLFRFATAGSVDDGKSTLVGRLLYDAKAILADQLDAVARTSADRGFGDDENGLDLALLTDGLRAEREQGITIDVAYRYFATDARNFVLADCPGHVEYTKNTVTGASTADAVVLLVDARHGVLEQTRRHLAVASLLRVPHVVVAVNKIDLIDYDEATFTSIVQDLEDIARELGVEERLRAVPVSALRGDNIVTTSDRTPWYTGQTLLSLLETLPGQSRLMRAAEPFRMAVQSVIRPQGGVAPGIDASEFRDFRGYTGQVTSGSVRVGDEIRVAASGSTARVTAIWNGDTRLEVAVPPQSVTLEIDADLDIARGTLLCASDSVPVTRNSFTAKLAWLSDRKVTAGTHVLIKHGTLTVKALVATIDGRLDLEGLDDRPAESLGLNDIGTVTLRTAAPLPIEDYQDHRHTGSFLVIDPHSGDTWGAGISRLQSPDSSPDVPAGTHE
ncbi:sulfate adenylyltransferase subunit 1 [Kocuria sp. HSID16901]|uniref:sulfate adenylyltransferase subunit 1 n=1 Tax=Kocuria sp. HSID16901 TaxID=2419505 RepID=UPI000660E77B|nr:GTP-binding protein [Kocuria sp. HSID16901]RUQ22516.1 sulfate adenylyltransferase [Kocuria sp. HSID16901]